MGNLVGGALSFLGARKAQSQAQYAADVAANAQNEAARLAAEEARFRPIGITTRFGSSQFGYDPETGRVSSAEYTVSPELRALQDRIMALTGQNLTFAEQAPGLYAPLTSAATGLFNLGRGYLAESPQQAAERYIAQQQELLAPSRERQFAQLQNRLFQTGRGGLSVGGTGLRPGGGEGLRAASPEMEAYYNALSQQDAALAAQAMEEGRRNTAYGAGLFSTGAGLLGGYGQGVTSALAPFSTSLGTVGSIEQLGMEPLTIGSSLGGRIANPQGAQALFTGGMTAAQNRMGPMGFSPLASFYSGAGQAASSMPGFNFSSLFGSPASPISTVPGSLGSGTFGFL